MFFIVHGFKTIFDRDSNTGGQEVGSGSTLEDLNRLQANGLKKYLALSYTGCEGYSIDGDTLHDILSKSVFPTNNYDTNTICFNLENDY